MSSALERGGLSRPFAFWPRLLSLSSAGGAMMERIDKASPRTVARIAGLLYLLDILTSLLGEALVGRTQVVPGDTVATAANISAHEPLLRWGVAANLFATACYVGVTVLFYALFKVVKRSVARLTMLTGLTALAIWTFGSLCQLAATLVLRGGNVNGSRAERQALRFLEWNAHAANIGLVVFGVFCLLIGYLIFTSTFLPRVLGILMVLGGLGLLTYLSPALAGDLYPSNVVLALVGETSLMLWLLLMGVNVQRWEALVSAARS